MREFKGSEIRNIAVVGHGASGKTSLVDALAFVSGASKRHGSVKDGTSLTDTAPEEVERGYSINLGVAHAEWLGTKINIIDTPGFLDFQGDAVAGFAAADGALCVVSANSGVEVGTERMFREAVKRRDPVLFVVSMMDKEHADFDRIYQQIKTRLTSKVIPVEVPLGEGPDFHGVINLFTKKALLYKHGSKSGEFQEVDIPADYRTQFDRYYQELIESISSTDDTLLERYLEGGEIGRDEAIAGMKEAMKRMELFPLFCVSSELNYGVQAVLNTVVELLPNAFEMEEVHAFKGAEGNSTVEIHAEDNKPFTALVFKTMSEPHVGDVSYFRIFSGCIANGQDVFNATRDTPEKLNHLSVAQGKERIEVNRLCAGDIGCVAKLRSTHTNDTLSTRDHPVRLPQIDFPEPIIELAVHATARADEEKLQAGLHKLARGRSDVPDALQLRDARDDRLRSRRAPSRDLDGEAASQVRRAGADDAAEDRLSRNAEGARRRAGKAQEADWRPRPVRRLLGAHRAVAARRRLRVHRQNRRRRDPSSVHSRRRQGNSGSLGARCARRISRRGLQGRGVRRLVPHRGLE